MIKIQKLDIYLPRFPENQVFDSRDLSFYKNNLKKSRKSNFFNIINKNKTSEIRAAWNKLVVNKKYEYYSKNIFLLDIKSSNSFFRGILCGVSSKVLNNEIVVPHEKVFEERAEKFKNYLDLVRLQAEPVVFGTSFSKEVINSIKTSVKNKPILDFSYKKINYSIRKLYLKDSINNFSKFYIIDGHHRTSSFKLFSENSKHDHNLLTFLTDIGNIKTDKFTWQVKEPSIKIINSIKKLDKTINKPDSNLYWALYNDEYFLFNKTHLSEMKLSNLEKWILKSGDIIKRHHEIKDKSTKGIIFNYPMLSIKKIIRSMNKQEIFPQKSTFLEPKMLTGLTINELVKI